MAAIDSCWLIGSSRFGGTVTIAASAESLTTDFYYLESNTAGRGLRGEFQAMMTSAGVAAANVFIGRNRKITLESSGVFTVTWGSGTVIRDFLGFNADLSGSTSYEAPNISTLLWSPGYPATMATRNGVNGYPVEDEVTSFSADGTIVDTDFHNTQVWQDMSWDAVFRDRVRADENSAQGGTFHGFREAVLKLNRRFYFHETVVEDSSDSTTVGLLPQDAIYKRRRLPRGFYDRKVRNHNELWNLGLECIEQAEYT